MVSDKWDEYLKTRLGKSCSDRTLATTDRQLVEVPISSRQEFAFIVHRT